MLLRRATGADVQDVNGIQDVLKRQHGIISRSQALDLGLTAETLRWRTRSGGRWQTVLPCVYATFTGPLTETQRYQAAVLFGGTNAVLTGVPALRLQRLVRDRDAAPTVVPVLVPHSRRPRSTQQVTLMRTRRPVTVRYRDDIPLAEPTRAVVDACRLEHDLDTVRGLLMCFLRTPKVTVESLGQEIEAAGRRGTGLLWQALRDYGAGVRSVAEAQAREKILQLPIPEPLFNPDLYLPDGTFLVRPDAYWPDAGLAFEVDSLEFHGDFHGWEETQRRHARMTARGLLVVHASPRRIGSDWPVLSAEVVAAYWAGIARPTPAVVVRPGR